MRERRRNTNIKYIFIDTSSAFYSLICELPLHFRQTNLKQKKKHGPKYTHTFLWRITFHSYRLDDKYMEYSVSSIYASSMNNQIKCFAHHLLTYIFSFSLVTGKFHSLSNRIQPTPSWVQMWTFGWDRKKWYSWNKSKCRKVFFCIWNRIVHRSLSDNSLS